MDSIEAICFAILLVIISHKLTDVCLLLIDILYELKRRSTNDGSKIDNQ